MDGLRRTHQLELTLDGETIPSRDLGAPVLCKNYDTKSGIATTLQFSKGQNDWYGCTNDLGGEFVFAQAAFENYTAAELWAAAPCAKATVRIFAGEQELGSVEIPPSRSPEDFHPYAVRLKAYAGVADLRLKIEGLASVFRVQFGA